MSNELKPCPFCGGKAELIRAGEYPYVECTNPECKVYVMSCDSWEEAVSAWNTRQQPDLSTVEAIDDAIDAKFAEIERLVELKWQIKSKEAGE